MPEMLEFTDAPQGVFPVATEEEILEYANKLRTAGDADFLDALLPSDREAPDTCLIANALNFSCSISPAVNASQSKYPDEYRYIWSMRLPRSIDAIQAQKLTDAVGASLNWELGFPSFVLPAHIGNAADAFDARLAFHEYAIPDLIEDE